MSRPRKSPIVVQVQKLLFGFKRRHYVCRGVVRGAQFVHRKDGRLAVLHPSTKKGGWQLSRFDDFGALGDIIRPSCDSALRDGLDGGASAWRLVDWA